VLADDDGPGGVPIVLAESGAILFYLAERTGRFLPADPADRYRAIQWLMFQMAGVGPTLGQAIHFAAVSPGHDYPTRRFALEMDRLLDVLDERLSRSACIAADAYSIADMAVLPWLRPLGRFFPDLRPRPNLERWRLELSTRPAVMRTDALAAKLAAQDAASFKAATPAMLDRYFGRSAPTPA
jgi:GST-like protein